MLSALQRNSTVRPCVVVLELRNQQIARSDLQKLANVGVPVIILGGAVELHQPGIDEFQWAAVLKRPFTLGDVAEAVELITAARCPK